MYRIMNETIGETIGYTQKPIYIRLSASGNYTITDEEHAQGIAYRSTPYNLRGREGVGVSETVYLTDVDEGLMISDLVEAGPMIAESNIPKDKYFTIGKRTFLAIQSIPSGEKIVPDINCTEVNLSEALNALNN